MTEIRIERQRQSRLNRLTVRIDGVERVMHDKRVAATRRQQENKVMVVVHMGQVDGRLTGQACHDISKWWLREFANQLKSGANGFNGIQSNS